MKLKGQMKRLARSPMGIVGGLCLFAIAAGAWSVGWADLWTTPDQRGARLFARLRYTEAAEAFGDPMWRGVALMKAGEFKRAAETFGGLETAEAAYDHGNALVMLGKYADAVVQYDGALALRPQWGDAAANRALAQLRADRMKAEGEDAGDQREGADAIVYDKKANKGGETTDVAGGAMTDEQVRAMWLKRVQTRPADFLRARFAYQLQAASQAAPDAASETAKQR
jgi:Ca-activated chloride channel family protein